MLKIALLVLTTTSDGGVLVTHSDMDNATECDITKQMVTSVLATSGIEVITAMCGESALRLTPFEHGATAAEEIHRYRVTIAAEGEFDVTPLAADSSCDPAPQASPAVYCGRSAQSVIE